MRQQIYSAWECIVIDGASKDRTLEIAKSYEAKDFLQTVKEKRIEKLT